MVVAVNANYLFKNYQREYEKFIYECFIRIAKKFPLFRFVFIFDKPHNASFNFPLNITSLVVGPEATNLILQKFWLNYKIPGALKKIKADIFITAGCSMPAKIPQVLIVSDIIFLRQHASIQKKYLKYYNRNLLKWLSKSSMIATLSEFSKNSIVRNFKVEMSKIKVLGYGVNEGFEPIDYSEKAAIKDKYSNGNEYFFVPGYVHKTREFLKLLKAFSIFKKWQKSNMQLLIIPGSVLKIEDLSESLRLFKYRGEVKLLSRLPGNEFAKVMAASYAVLFTNYQCDFELAPVESMKCNVPVISGKTGAMDEIFGKAALYFDSEDHTAIAEKMMMIFKDETLRDGLIKKGNEQVEKYNWERTTESFWDTILKAKG